MDLFASASDLSPLAPLAEKMRPAEASEIVGQSHLLGPKGPLRQILDKGVLSSLLLWGPPGTGKTTIARLIASRAEAAFIELSATSDGVTRIREVVHEAEERWKLHQQRTVVFVDEIHRWSKSTQDHALPAVERGLLTLIGATTENVSHELRPALLSRCRVFVLERPTPADVRAVLVRALSDTERGLGKRQNTASDAVLDLIAESGAGDVRKSLGALELAAQLTDLNAAITEETARHAIGHQVVHHDKDGDHHYQLASAYQKACRGSDVQAALFYMARMLEGGDISMIVRRMLVIAAEDIGMADPSVLVAVEAAARSFERVGFPEGEHFLSYATVLLATAPKSNRAYQSLKAAKEAVRRHPEVDVPLHLRNLTETQMKVLGKKAQYRNPQHEENHFAAGQTYLPKGLEGEVFYRPSTEGNEARIRERMTAWYRLQQDFRDS